MKSLGKTWSVPRRINPLALGVWFVFTLLGACSNAPPLRVELPAQHSRAFSLLDAEYHQRIPIQVIGNYVFLDGSVVGRSGGFILDTGTPYPVFLNNSFLPLKLDRYVATGKAGAALGNVGREQVVYAHPDVALVRIGNRVVTSPGVLLSSNFGYIADMESGGIRPDFLGFVGLPVLFEHEFVLDYAQGALDLYRLDAQGEPLITHVQSSEIVATLAFYRRNESGIGGHLPFVDIEIAGIPFVGMLDTGTLGELALTPEAHAQLEARGALQKTPQGWRICHAAYRGAELRLDIPSMRQSDSNTIALGHNLLQHYRSVWNYRKQTVTLLTGL